MSSSPKSSRSASAKGDLYSVILPTYNERENLPLIVCMIDRAFYDMYEAAISKIVRLVA